LVALEEYLKASEATRIKKRCRRTSRR